MNRSRKQWFSVSLVCGQIWRHPTFIGIPFSFMFIEHLLLIFRDTIKEATVV